MGQLLTQFADGRLDCSIWKRPDRGDGRSDLRHLGRFDAKRVHASLPLFAEPPVTRLDIIKIDKSFVDRLASGNASMAIVEGLMQIAQKLDIRVVAEGIETEHQAELLLCAGCALGQGYLFSYAVDGHETTNLLLQRAQHADSPAVIRQGKATHG